MARKVRRSIEETDSLYETQATPSVMEVSSPEPDRPPLIDPTPLVGDATARESAVAAEEVPVPKKYELQRAGSFMVGGFMTSMRAGKIIDERYYDVPSLLSQGALLQEV